jgi:hypothetical protein
MIIFSFYDCCLNWSVAIGWMAERRGNRTSPAGKEVARELNTYEKSRARFTV